MYMWIDSASIRTTNALTTFPSTKNKDFIKSCQGYIPEETDMQDTAFVDALNFSNRFPDIKSITHTIPSAPAV